MAYDYKNYRISCPDVNSSYKRNFFPLKTGTSIVYDYNETINSETPILLDPTVKEDPPLLTFEANGKVVPTYTDDDWKNFRADISIKIYGLNDVQGMKDARQRKWHKCNRLIAQANKKFIQYNNELANFDRFFSLKQDFDYFIDEIKSIVNPETKFSAVAVACLKSYSYDWINEFVFD